MFEEFYKRYPRKIGRGAARKAYLKAVKIDSHDEIMEGLENAIVYWRQEGTDKQFIPHPSTWLNQERWADEYEIDLRTQKQMELDKLKAKPYNERTQADWYLLFRGRDLNFVLKNWKEEDGPRPESVSEIKKLCGVE